MNNKPLPESNKLGSVTLELSVAPDGDFHVLSGDLAAGEPGADLAYVGLERLKTSGRLRDSQTEKDTQAQLNAVYLERNRVVAALAKAFPSGLARTAIEGWEEDWHGCVYIDLPTGQASWHFHDSEAYLFQGLPPYQGTWDGHSTEEKYERLARLVPAEHKDNGSANAYLLELTPIPKVGELANQISVMKGAAAQNLTAAELAEKLLVWMQERSKDLQYDVAVMVAYEAGYKRATQDAHSKSHETQATNKVRQVLELIADYYEHHNELHRSALARRASDTELPTVIQSLLRDLTNTTTAYVHEKGSDEQKEEVARLIEELKTAKSPQADDLALVNKRLAEANQEILRLKGADFSATLSPKKGPTPVVPTSSWVPIYQIRKAFADDPDDAWRDADHKAWASHPPKHRRVVFGIPPSSSSPKTKP